MSVDVSDQCFASRLHAWNTHNCLIVDLNDYEAESQPSSSADG